MLEEIKLANKISSYGLAKKSQFLYAIFFFLIGLVIDIFSKEGNFLGGFYIILSGMFIYQMVLSTGISTLVQSSPYKYKIMVRYPYMAILPWMIIQFVIVAIIHYVKILTGTEGISARDNLNNQNVMMLTLGMMVFLLEMYFGICYKFFYAAVVGFVIVMMAFSICVNIELNNLFDNVSLSYGLCCVISFLFMIAGWGISYLLAKKFYKYDLHKAAFKQLTRNMKK